MSKKQTFYGTKKETTFSYMEFGSINIEEGTKSVYDFKMHQKAYDWLMHARYSNDIYGYHVCLDLLKEGKFDELKETYFEEVHHNNDAHVNLLKLIGLMSVQGEDSFFELGQTLFGCIDGMQLVNAILENANAFDSNNLVDLKQVDWHGVDISDFFNRFAKITHNDYKTSTYNDLNALTKKTKVFFAKGVTLLYAVTKLEELFDLMGKSELSVFDYSFALEGEQETRIGTGKTVRYLSLQSFLEMMKKDGKHMFVREETLKVDKELGRVFVECLYGTEEDCLKFKENYEKARTAVLKSALGDVLYLTDHSKSDNWVNILDVKF